MTIDWQWARFDALDGAAVHAMLAARQQVFVLEQRCLYPDIDGRDPQARHLLGWQGQGSARELVAYLRCFMPGTTELQTFNEEAVIGRVLTTANVRGQGVGRQLMAEGIHRIEREFPGARIRLSAQAHLQAFYAGFGFAVISDVYLEDGIPHIDMLR